MALPTSRSTTYVVGSTPTIKAQDLNDLQDYTAGLYTGNYSHKAIVVDGTGGVGPGSPTPGNITASGNVVAASLVSNSAAPPSGTLSITGNVAASAVSHAKAIIHAADMFAYNDVNMGFGGYFWEFNTNTTGKLYIPIKLPFQDPVVASSTIITGITVRCKQASTTAMTATLYELFDITNVGSDPVSSSSGTATSGIVAGNCNITMSAGLPFTLLNTTALMVEIAPGAVGDFVYAATISYTYKLW